MKTLVCILLTFVAAISSAADELRQSKEVKVTQVGPWIYCGVGGDYYLNTAKNNAIQNLMAQLVQENQTRFDDSQSTGYKYTDVKVSEPGTSGHMIVNKDGVPTGYNFQICVTASWTVTESKCAVSYDPTCGKKIVNCD